MPIGLGIGAAGLGVQAAQASRFVGLPARWPRPFRDVVPVRTAEPSPGSSLPWHQEVARRPSAVTSRPASMALPASAGAPFRAGGLRPGPGWFLPPLSASPRGKT
jgi:hypothetical protein